MNFGKLHSRSKEASSLTISPPKNLYLKKTKIESGSRLPSPLLHKKTLETTRGVAAFVISYHKLLKQRVNSSQHVIWRNVF